MKAKMAEQTADLIVLLVAFVARLPRMGMVIVLLITVTSCWLEFIF